MGASGKLEVLPTRSDSAAANMAADFLLLRRYPEARRAHARFRAYGWHRPAFTFGYSQKIAWVRAQLPADAEGVELVRRPTGGGLVDHRDDWTYALVIPRGHELEKARAVDSYRAVHAALAAALVAVGQAAVLMERCEPAADFDAVRRKFGRAGEDWGGGGGRRGGLRGLRKGRGLSPARGGGLQSALG
jgi:lipoate-protein ligase A